MIELATRYKELMLQLKDKKPDQVPSSQALDADRILFEEMAEACLWGNATGMDSQTSALWLTERD